ncbi:hypothetical protein E1B28_010414 [Marasmius oreades]|uniref:RRM domain-containing protein n=1 Tax=Marasmius oreades TaxID=181124 RepID=A0A9P7RX10_9AGAR|nr:uncharacterized protein E1B28_010414 [Marasmius oreades]KAG7091374.1 hypothetical protein E1B28_010414 [Marasmius oreades]
MDNAWQSQDIAPSASGNSISIPAQDISNGGGSQDESSFSNGAPAPRRSRSRSPGDRGRGSPEEANNPGNNLHVSGLSNKVDSRDLESAFAKIGRVSKASVVYDPHTRESRLFGFVTMETAEEAEAAVTALNASEFMGKVITVQKARRGRARTPTPGRYHGPSKRASNFDRPYDPRPYDSRYARDYDEKRRGGRYEGRRGGYDDRDRDRHRDYDKDKDYRRDDRGRYDDREKRYDDRERRHDDRERRYDDRDRRY